MRLVLAVVSALALSVPSAPAAQASAGTVKVTVVGGGTGGGKVGMCIAAASPPIALITLSCNPNAVTGSGEGIGVAVWGPAVGPFVCGSAFAVFADNTTATDTDCL